MLKNTVRARAKTVALSFDNDRGVEVANSRAPSIYLETSAGTFNMTQRVLSPVDSEHVGTRDNARRLVSLTEHMRDSGSPVRAYLDSVVPALADSQGRSDDARRMVQALGLVDLARCRTLVTASPGVDTGRSGSAIDFRVRIALGGFDPHESAAAAGVARLPYLADGDENRSHRARVLTQAFDVAQQMLERPSDDEDLDRASILLACCEQAHRSGAAALEGSLGRALDKAEDGLAFAQGIDEASLIDIRTLMETNAFQLREWHTRINSGDRFEPNPTFAGSALVGGADGDWVIGETLFDSKAYTELAVFKLRSFLRQLLGYVLLDSDDALRIRSVGLWLPRQRETRVWTLRSLLGGDPEELLPALREGLQASAGGKSVAVRVPVTQLRKHQLLAENEHTPRWMLNDLALNEDVGLRFRVGRNVSTPEETLRELARDRFAKVREGVARNERAPSDVLADLSHDSSVVVRRAASENARTPKHVLTLGRGRSAQPHLDNQALPTGIIVPVPAAVGYAEMPLKSDRDSQMVDSRWVRQFLFYSRGSTVSWMDTSLPIPEASRRWALKEKLSLDLIKELGVELPDAIKRDLMRPERPAWVRRIVAGRLSIRDRRTRDLLLVDPDPEIRWSTLQRTVDAPDDGLGDLLGRLAADRKERIRFRTDGNVEPTWSRRKTPSEYETETLQLVVAHPSTPHSSLRDHMSAKSPEILIALLGSPVLSADELAGLLPRLLRIRSIELRERLAESDRIAATVATALCEDREVRVRVSLAKNTSAPTQALSQLAGDPDPSVRVEVLRNTQTSPDLAASIAESFLSSSTDELLLEILSVIGQRDDIDLSAELVEDALDRLSKSRVREPDMRCMTAEDRRTGPHTLSRLARSSDVDVRRSVAGNPRTPSEGLTVLASAPEAAVRAAAAGNETLSVSILVALAHDDEVEVQASAAGNPNLDPQVLGDLLLGEHWSVRAAASGNPSTRPDDKARADAELERRRRELAPSRSDLEEMAANTRAEARIRVAYEPSTPPDILRLLAGDRRSAKVRCAVAANPNAAASLLASLASDKDEDVRRAVALNRATPQETLTLLANSGIDLAILVALNPEAPAEILNTLSQDVEPLVRHIANNALTVRAELAPGRSRPVLCPLQPHEESA